MKAGRGEERLKGELITESNLQRSGFRGSFPAPDSSPHGSELENYRDSAVELPATSAPATEARDSLRCPPKDASQGPGRLEDPAVVNIAVALGFAKGPVTAGL